MWQLLDMVYGCGPAMTQTNNFVFIDVIAKIMLYDVKMVVFFNNIVKQLSLACL